MDNIISAIMSFAGALIGSLFLLLANFINNKSENERLELSLKNAEADNQKNISVQYITNKRVDWIYEVRNTLSEYIALAQECANKKVHDKKMIIPDKICRELNVYLAKLRLLLNFTGFDDKIILELLDKIKDNISRGEEFSSSEFQEDIILLTKYSQVYLKLEWERVKCEIEGVQDINGEQKNKIGERLSTLRERYYKEYIGSMSRYSAN